MGIYDNPETDPTAFRRKDDDEAEWLADAVEMLDLLENPLTLLSMDEHGRLTIRRLG